MSGGNASRLGNTAYSHDGRSHWRARTF